MYLERHLPALILALEGRSIVVWSNDDKKKESRRMIFVLMSVLVRVPAKLGAAYNTYFSFFERKIYDANRDLESLILLDASPTPPRIWKSQNSIAFFFCVHGSPSKATRISKLNGQARVHLLYVCEQKGPRVSRMGNRRFGDWEDLIKISRREIPYFAGEVLYLDCTALVFR